MKRQKPIQPKPCKICGSETHTSLMCFKKKRKPLANKKFVKRFGKKAAEWREAKNQWIQDHPPSHEGYWFCYICGKALTIYTLTLDHKIAWSRRPDLRLEDSNLEPCCFADNSNKGSKSYDKFMEERVS